MDGIICSTMAAALAIRYPAFLVPTPRLALRSIEWESELTLQAHYRTLLNILPCGYNIPSRFILAQRCLNSASRQVMRRTSRTILSNCDSRLNLHLK